MIAHSLQKANLISTKSVPVTAESYFTLAKSVPVTAESCFTFVK